MIRRFSWVFVVGFMAFPAQLPASDFFPGVTISSNLASYSFPKGVEVPGDVIMTARWQDRLGANLLVLSQKEVPPPMEEDGELTFRLFADHWVQAASTAHFRPLWKMRDGVEGCQFDSDIRFLGLPRISELNGNGVAESTLLYLLTCRSDVSGAPAKLIMHEGKTKYAIRGASAYPESADKQVEGTMDIDPSFNKAPKTLRDFAIKTWRAEIMTQQL
jgi:hypothetical protein